MSSEVKYHFKKRGSRSSSTSSAARESLAEKRENCGKKFGGEKLHVADDVYLTDHTVATDDPRLTDAYNSRTRIRRLTGFDSSLLRDRVWAVKTNNDISKGLARVEKIERQMKQHEQGRNRAYDAEKMNLERRLSRLASRSRPRGSSFDAGSQQPTQVNKELDRMKYGIVNHDQKIGTYLKHLEQLLAADAADPKADADDDDTTSANGDDMGDVVTKADAPVAVAEEDDDNQKSPVIKRVHFATS